MPSKRYGSKRSFGTRFNDIKEEVEVSIKRTPPDIILNDGVDYSKVDANSIDATTINFGGIEASNFSQGAKIPSGESNQRVPADLTDVDYWEQVTSGLLELHKQGFHNDEDIQHVESTAEGIYFTPTATEPARIYLTGRLPIPKSRKVYATWEADRAVNLRLIWWKNSQPVEVTATSTTDGVATITTATTHSFAVGNEIRVTGLDINYNGYHTVTAVGTYSVSYASPTIDDDLVEDIWETRGKVNLEDYVYEELTDKVQWDADYRSANVSNKILNSNIATLTTNASHEFVVGDTVIIRGIDSTFDGTVKITSVTDTTFSYQKEASNVGSTVVSPVVQVTSDDSRSASEYAIYLEVAAGADTVLLKSAKAFEVLGYGAKAPLYANVNNSVLTNNVVTLTTSENHSFAQDSSVVVSNIGSPYDGTHIILGGSNAPTSNTFRYTVINANVNSNVANGKAVAYDRKQRTELTPDGLRLYQPNGTLAVDLTTASSSVFNIYYGGNAVTSIDYEGNGKFASLGANSFVQGTVDIVGTFEGAEFNGTSYNQYNTANIANNETETTNSFLNRLARGTIYQGYVTDVNDFTFTQNTRSYTLASGNFKLENNRSYVIQTSFNSMYGANDSNVAVQAILKMGTGPVSIGGANAWIQRSIVGPATNASFSPMVTQIDATQIGTKSLVIGKKIESNVVTLLMSNPTSNINFSDNVGVIGVGYPYDGYWTVSTTNITPNSVAYTLPISASNTATNSRTTTVALVSGQTGVSVPSTSGLYVGFPVKKVSGVGAFGTNAVVSTITNSTHFTTDVVHATSGNLTFTVIEFQSAGSESYVIEQFTLGSSVVHSPQKGISVTSNVDVFYTLELFRSTNANTNVTISFNSSPVDSAPINISVIDVGQVKNGIYQLIEDVGRTTTGSQSPEFGSGNAGATITQTRTFSASDSAYYDNYGKGTGTTNPYAYRDSLYQGDPQTASGIKKSAILFNAFGLPATATVVKAELYLKNRHSYNASGLTCYIGAHIENTLGSTVPTQPTASLGSSVITTNFARGQGKWVDVTSVFGNYIESNVLRGFLIGLTAASNTWYSGLANYGYFDGEGMSDPPKLRVTYTYTTA